MHSLRIAKKNAAYHGRRAASIPAPARRMAGRPMPGESRAARLLKEGEPGRLQQFLHARRHLDSSPRTGSRSVSLRAHDKAVTVCRLSTGALQHDRWMNSRGEKSSFCHDADIEAASPAITHAHHGGKLRPPFSKK
jgi:hypothetical protein